MLTQPARILFREALDLDEGQRDAWLERLTADNPELAAQVKNLLAADALETGILDRSLQSIAGDLQSGENEMPADREGERIGSYRIVAGLGVGGMGSVYRAEREAGDFAQTVALKLVRSGTLTSYARQRFVIERSILASLQHPHIAHLIEGGIDSASEPWFAMEYIHGKPLLAWCDDARLSLRQRLALFLDVCAAVEYAHAKLVIHRDIKPTNVMVDENGVVKLLDFGIAKLLDKNDAQSLTLSHARLLTPAYAAPEQVRGERATTATDVHGLGLLLYEILCGRRAFGTTQDSPHVLQNDILEHDPPNMALRLEQRNDPNSTIDSQTIARRRQLEIAELQAYLRGDLQNIVAKALRKEPEQRYRSVTAFKDDILRYLADEPVAAAGGAQIYLIRKFIRRNRIAVGLSAVVALAILAGVSGILWQSNRAEQEARTAIAVRDFLVNVFAAADPEQHLGKPQNAVELLDIGSHKIDTELSDQPVVQAHLYQALGTSYSAIGEYAKSQALFEKGLALADRLLSETDPIRMQLELNLSDELGNDKNDAPRVVALLNRLIVAQETLPVGRRQLLARAYIRLSNMYMNHNNAQALSYSRKAVATVESLDQSDENVHIAATESLGKALSVNGLGDEAIAAYRKVLAFYVRKVDPLSPSIGETQMLLAQLLLGAGKWSEAETLMRQVCANDTVTLGERHPRHMVHLLTFADALILNDKPDEAESLLKHALDVADGLDEKDQIYAANISNRLAKVKNFQEDYPAALRYCDRATRFYTAKFGENDTYFLNSVGLKASILVRSGQYAQAESLLRNL